ncbi:cytochrome P450 [Coprinopsis cinerea AmutBmut pab1-1]|nr:cytochrome P450 [Coprinopsis cinerea AmutBmut pab1-1]
MAMASVVDPGSRRTSLSRPRVSRSEREYPENITTSSQRRRRSNVCSPFSIAARPWLSHLCAWHSKLDFGYLTMFLGLKGKLTPETYSRYPWNMLQGMVKDLREQHLSRRTYPDGDDCSWLPYIQAVVKEVSRGHSLVRLCLRNGAFDQSVLDPDSVAFGFVCRICPGRDLSKEALLYTAACLLAVFKIEPVKDQNGEDIPLELKTGIIFGPEPF